MGRWLGYMVLSFWGGGVRHLGLWRGFESKGSAFRWFFETFVAAERVLSIDQFHQASVQRCSLGCPRHLGLDF